MKNIITVLLIFALLVTGKRPAYSQFQGANPTELCCYIVFFPVIYPVTRFQRWWGERPVTRVLGKNRVKLVRRTINYDMYEPSRIRFGELFEDMELFVGERKVLFKQNFIYFHANGSIEKGCLLKTTEFLLMNQPVKIAPGETSFYDDGLFQGGTLEETVFFMIDGKKTGFAGGSHVTQNKLND